jgi:ligand-binding sensor domain-containing protein
MLFAAAAAAVASTAFAQTIDLCEQWRTFAEIDQTTSLALDHQYLWVGTKGGLVRFDTLSYDAKLYDKTNSGLPVNAVTSLVMDRTGRLWIGTYGGGVARLDRGVWSTFDASNSALKSNYILSLALDSTGAVWVGTGGGGVAKSTGNAFVVVPLPNPPSYNKIDAITTDIEGNIWLSARAGNNYNELDKFDGSKWVWYDDTNSLILPGYIFALACGRDSTIWMGCDEGELESLDTGDWEAWVSQPGVTGGESPVYGIATDDSGAVWTASWTGCAKFYRHKWHVIADGHSYAVLVHGGTTWFANNPGILRLRGDTTTRFLAGLSLPSNNLALPLTVDGKGNTWATSTATALISIFDGTSWRNITPQSIADGKAAYPSALAADSAGNTWIALRGLGIVRYDGQSSYVFNDTNSALDTNVVTGLAYDKMHHKLWAGTSKGLALYDGTSWSSFDYPRTLPIYPLWNGFNGFTVDPSGVVWATAAFGGLLRFDGTNWKVFGEADGLPSASSTGIYTTGVACDANGAIWVATDSGLAKYENGAFTVYTSSNSALATSDLNSVAIDPRGRVWVGTWRAGAAMFDHGTWTNLDQNNSGITNNQISWVTADAAGHVWYAMENDGLTEYSPTGFTPLQRLFSNDTVSECGATASNVVQFVSDGCLGRKIVTQRITGPDSLHYSIVHAATTGNLTSDSVVIKFMPDAARPFQALLEITLEDSSIYRFPLNGFGPNATPVALGAAGAYSDVIGSTVIVPILLGNSASITDAELNLHYDTSMLVYQGTTSNAGAALDDPGSSWEGGSRIHVRKDDLQAGSDTVAFARFLLYPQANPCSDVTIDSVRLSGPAKNCLVLSNDSVVVHICSSIACGSNILSQYLRYGVTPSLRILPNPAGATAGVRSSVTLGATTIDVLDQLGSTVAHLQGDIKANETFPIDLSGVTDGMYFLRITSGSFSCTNPLIHYAH